MAQPTHYLTEASIQATRNHIREAGGNEVFFVGKTNPERMVDRVKVFARGNETSTPALMQVARQGNVIIHNHPSGTLRPSGADLHVASTLGNDGIGFYIVDNEVSDIFVVVEPFQKKKVVPLDSNQLAELIGQNGPISKKLEKYEFRPQQRQMIEAICGAINHDKIALIEAGTGTGKTLAYLLPGITYAIQNKERIVVSTNTINLQEQLIHKDLPFLNAILPQKFKAVLVKGRTNYACKRKLLEAEQDLDLFSENEDKKELAAITEWSKKTRDGSRSELNIEPKRQVWEKIQSESDTSLKTKCPYYDQCFFYTARRSAASADILVANHHLLFSDLAVRSAHGGSENAVLPAYERLILDEAHNIEDVATNYFGLSATYLGTMRILNKIYSMKDADEKGLLVFLSHKLAKFAFNIPHDKLSKIQPFIKEIAIPSIEVLKGNLADTMEVIFHTLMRDEQSQYREVKLRLTRQVLVTADWQDRIIPASQKLVKMMRKIAGAINGFLGEIEGFQHKLGPTVSSLTIDLQAQSDRLKAASNTIEQVLLIEDDNNTRWIEAREGYKSSKILRLRSAPLDVAPILKTNVYDRFKNVVLTSATLTVAGRFDFLKKQLGIDIVDAGKTVQEILPAPFDYKRQALVAIPSDIPDPRERSYIDVIPKLLLRSIEISKGRAFVLFTAYGLLNVVYNRLRKEIEDLGHNVYKQGQENRHRLLERFRDDTSSVLFATDSFWEGVDVQGESLESVIITKLPFRVPSEPIIEARVEAIERRGGNAFSEYTVPQAAIKFKQGFGRLIRRKTDRGSVLILDKRVIQKSYGQVFLNSLPEVRIVSGTTDQVFLELQRFYSKNVAEG